LNRVWDRADAAMDYAWKSSENEADRQNRIAVAEMQQEDDNGLLGAVGSIAGSVLGNYAGSVAGSQSIKAGLGAIFSDARLKENLKPVGALASGLTIYEWTWSDKAKEVGAANQPAFGVVAQEAEKIIPEAVSTGAHGYLMIDYSKVY